MRVWLEGGLSRKTVHSYCTYVRPFIDDCKRRGALPDDELTRPAVIRFAARYARKRGIKDTSARNFLYALHAWSRGLRACGAEVPPWAPPAQPRPLPPLLTEFVEYLLAHRGVRRVPTAGRMVERVQGFLRFLRSRGRPMRRLRLADIDAHVLELGARFARRTVKQVCTAIRAFLRFLLVTGRLARDLAEMVISPRHRSEEQPPRALPWKDVQAILRSVDRRTPAGRRDYAMLLVMASYGLGGAEVRGIRLEDVNWTARTIRVRRPKTEQEILLPLLPAVARALAVYLRGRPPHSPSRAVFVQVHAPRASAYEGLTSSAVSGMVEKYARLAGVKSSVIGSHTLRHSHATRQVELGAPMKVVGDILGHRSPQTTSAYVRVALNQLRQVALPVPS